MTIQLNISDESLPGFLCCLGIGTLYAIQSGILPPETGIWTLAIPRFSMPLEQIPTLSDEIITIFQQCDELDALREVASPEEYHAQLNALIGRLANELRRIQGIKGLFWEADWELDGGHDHEAETGQPGKTIHDVLRWYPLAIQWTGKYYLIAVWGRDGQLAVSRLGNEGIDRTFVYNALPDLPDIALIAPNYRADGWEGAGEIYDVPVDQ